MKKSIPKKKSSTSKSAPKVKLIDDLGRTYRIDVSVLKSKIKSEGPMIQSLIDNGVRQFLGLDCTPMTREMKDFLISMGIITALSVRDTEEIIQLNS